MRIGALVLAAALIWRHSAHRRRPRGVVGAGVLRPGGRGGRGDHRGVRAGHRKAGRAGPAHPDELIDMPKRRSQPGSRPTFCSAPLRLGTMGLRGPARSISRLPLVQSWTCSIPTPSRRRCRSTAGPAGAACTACRWAGVPTTSMSGTASGARGLHARGHPQRVGGLLVLLVRPGAAGSAQGPGPRRRLGHRAAHVATRSTPRTSSSSSSSPTETPWLDRDRRLQIDDPKIGRE